MLPSINSVWLLAQQAGDDTGAGSAGNSSTQMLTLLILVILTVLALFFVGGVLGKRLRMPGYGWKIGIILLAIVGGLTITSLGWPPKLGIDLSGGVILVYEVDEKEKEVDMDALVTALKRRINPSGVKEVVIRQYGDRQVEIIIPEVQADEIEYLKMLITKSGALKFRIMAEKDIDDQRLFQLAQKQEEDARENGLDPSDQVYDGEELIGEWVRVAKVEGSDELNPSYQVEVDSRQNELRDLGGQLEVLMYITRFNVEGEHLKSATTGHDEVGRPAVHFNMTGPGSVLFSGLTSMHKNRRLGIVMDRELLSAPNIRSTITNNGIIEGEFTQKEVQLLVDVLKAGKLPSALKKDPISDQEISAILGADTVRKGKFAISISFGAVLLFMAVYYRFSGVVACLALCLNLLLILTMMILFKAAFTLPGLAGLVLTVGMSVDANVLIFERIREELGRGTALRMAIRNGFGRATTTIVDANITTLITAIVLYAIGTDQIRGFAVTLILGILMSMFTAIFCSRVLFDVAERVRWITHLRMTKIFGELQVDFIGKRKLAAACSSLLIIVGLCGAVYRGKNLFDIDFNGGTSVEVMLKQPMAIEKVRARLAEGLGDYDPSVVEVKVENHLSETIYKVDTAITGEIDLENPKSVVGADISGLTLVKQGIERALPGRDFNKEWEWEDLQSETGQVKTRIILPAAESTEEVQNALMEGMSSFEPVVEATDSTDGKARNFDVHLTLNGVRILQHELMRIFADDLKRGHVDFDQPVLRDASDAGVAIQRSLPAPSLLAFAGNDATFLAQADGDSAGDTTGEVAVDSEAEITSGEPATDKVPTVTRVTSQTTLTFGENVNKRTVLNSLQKAAQTVGLAGVPIRDRDLNTEDNGKHWSVELRADVPQLVKILKELKKTVGDSPVWLSSNKIGGKVAGDTRNKAVAALVACLLGIVFYIWIRFQRVHFGLAAVVALVHDVLITLGMLALSFWLADVFGFLLIQEFKINLPIIAAFLTIIGYSLNDTIVVFDRVREVRGKSPEITKEIINKSINQTLARTVLTSLTTLLVVLILYVLGGESIHGFAYALVVGIMVGTYSSIFVASPALLWMTAEPETARKSRRERVTA
jgi:SecD/SecF fusion protein